MTESSSRNSTPSPKFGLGKRLFSRTTDVIAISIILFAGFSMGGSVLEWWRTTPDDAHSRNLTQVAEDATPPDWNSGAVMMDAGILDVRLQRQEWVGTPDQAHERMVKILIERLNSGILPAADLDEQEQEMIRAVEELEPIWSDDTGAEIYHHDAPLASYVAVRRNFSEVENPSQNPVRRVVSWGFVVATSQEEWTAWLMTPHGSGDHELKDDWRSCLPESAECDLGLHSEDRHLMMSFSGEGVIVDWQHEFETLLTQRSFEKTEEWAGAETHSTAKFALSHPTLKQFMTIQIQQEAGGRLRGLMHVSPPREETP